MRDCSKRSLCAYQLRARPTHGSTHALDRARAGGFRRGRRPARAIRETLDDAASLFMGIKMPELAALLDALEGRVITIGRQTVYLDARELGGMC